MSHPDPWNPQQVRNKSKSFTTNRISGVWALSPGEPGVASCCGACASRRASSYYSRLLPCARNIPLYTWIRSKYRSKGVHNAIRPHHHYTSYQALRLPRPVQPSITRTSLINCWLQLGKQSYLLPCIQQIKVKIRWWKLVMTVRMLQH